jgi:hypothetical protein
MADCLCTDCSEKSKTRLAEFITAINTINNLSMISGRKLDLLYVLSNEINAINGMIAQIDNNMKVFTSKIADMDAGNLPSSLKACIEQSLADLKVNTPEEYDIFLAAVTTLWDGKFEKPAEEVKPELGAADVTSSL